MELQDNIFTKLIRPTALTATLLIFFVLMILDGNVGGFTIKEGYLSILETILTTMVIFYFSSRGLEKVATTISNNQAKTKEDEMLLKELKSKESKKTSMPKIDMDFKPKDV